MIRPFAVAVSAFVLFLGCGPVEDAASPRATAARSSDLVAPNGSNLNGSNLNGSNLNGSNLNGSDLGTVLASVSLANVKLGGSTKLDRTELRGTVFYGWNGASESSGTDFLQAEFAGTLGDGAPVRLRIEAVNPGTAPDEDVWTYRVSYRDGATNSWWPICKDDVGAIDAIPVMGTWNLQQGVTGGGAKSNDGTAFTFACVGRSAIAKCVSAGYKPWKSVNGVSLDRHHQACVRLIRADFCGDGTSHTTDGQWVNLYDGVGVQQDTEEWVLEAEWDEHGARCFYPLNRSHEAVPCYDQRQDLACGSPTHFATGTLLINETPGDGVLDDSL